MASAEPAGKGGSLRRDAGIIALLFASTTSIIGSGWLFGAFHAAKLAGPLSVWSWVLGAAIILLIAMCFAELGALFPRSGALVHMSHASHGTGLGQVWGWILFLSYAAIPAVEAEAVLTYTNNYLPYFIRPGSDGLLTSIGFVTCAALLGLFSLINLLTVKKLLAVNTTITWWKIGVPILTIIVLIASSVHLGGSGHVWHADPHGYSVSGIFIALPTAGIVFSYFGFRTAIDLGGESSNPGRNIPLAVVGSVVLCAVIYVLLQVAFLMGLNKGDLANGWAHLNFVGEAGPFAGLAVTLGIGWMAMLLYVDAFISPGGTGLIYVTGGARILFAIGETKGGPAALTKLNSSQIPWVGVLIMWVVGVFFLLPFPAWQLMVQYITSITVLTYGIGPVVLMVLRRSQPNLDRRFTLWNANILAPLAFVFSNLIIYWTGFKTNEFLFILLGICVLASAGYYHFVAKNSASDFKWQHIAWLVPWFGGLWVISYLGGIGGGIGVLSFWVGNLVIVLWSLFILWLALRSALPVEETEKLMAELEHTR